MRKQFLIFFLAIFIGSSVSFANNNTKVPQLKTPTVTSYKSTKTDISNSNFSCQVQKVGQKLVAVPIVKEIL